MSEPAVFRHPAGHSLAYHQRAGSGPGVVFLGGFMSDMSGTKARFLEAWCAQRGWAYLRFDYFGHGASDGRFEHGTIGRWTDDAIGIIDALTQGPQILVGSSMGGWIMLLAALARPERIAALVGIAAAPDFTEDLMLPAFSADERAALERDGRITQPSDYSESPYTITKALIDDARQHLLLRQSLPLTMPVRLLHGQQDPDIPWQRSLTLTDRLAAADVRLTLIKDGDHRLSRDKDLELLGQTLVSLRGNQ